MSLTYKRSESELLVKPDKSVILQGAKDFNKSPIRPKLCRLIISDILRVLYTNDNYTEDEATELFFSVTRLFLSNDASLRQMCLLAVKELMNKARDVIIITSTLTKDMQPKQDCIFRPNAIRTLSTIIDNSILPSVERVLKTCIVEKKDSSINCAALTSSYNIYDECSETIKRWSNEILDALIEPKNETSKIGTFMPSFFGKPQEILSQPESTIYQYHALGLLYRIKKEDKMAMLKILQHLLDKNNSNAVEYKNDYAYCLAIRMANDYINKTNYSKSFFYDKLCMLLRHRSDNVNFEAAKTILSMKNVTPEQIYPAINTLKDFFGSSKTVYRLASIKLINKVAYNHVKSFNNWNIGLEELINDTNKSVAILAITTMLVIGNESKIDTLVNKVEEFITDVSDEHKIIIVQSVKNLALKYKDKSERLVDLIGTMLRYESGIAFKQSIVNTLIELNETIPNIREKVLLTLSEFIEDCEYPFITTQILYFIGSCGVSSSTPSTFIRFIYNRIVLETSNVRAAAVSALSKFLMVSDEKVRKNVSLLLKSCLEDENDEVRDRAQMGLNASSNNDLLQFVYNNSQIHKLDELETALNNYCEDDNALEEQFDFTKINTTNIKDELKPKKIKETTEDLQDDEVESDSTSEQFIDLKGTGDEDVLSLQEISRYYSKASEFGDISNISNTIDLTDSAESEYPVKAIKYIFNNNIIIQFICKNTIEGCRLENICINMETDEEVVDLVTREEAPESLKLIDMIEIDTLALNETKFLFAVFEKKGLPSALFRNVITFKIKEFDQSLNSYEEEGYDEELALQDIRVCVGDYLKENDSRDFEQLWKALGDETQVIETFVLSEINSIKDGVEYLANIYNIDGNKHAANSTNISIHSIKVLATLNNKHKMALRIRMAVSNKQEGMTVEVNCKSESLEVSEIIVNAIE